MEAATTAQTLQKTRTADAVLSAAGAAGSLMLLQVVQDFLSANTDIETPIIGGFLVGSSIKLFLNRNPPTLDAFWKSTAFSIVLGSTIHNFLWTETDKGVTTILSKEHNAYVMLFFMLLFWKLHPGTIWGAANSLASFLAYQSGFWAKSAPQNGALQILAGDFPAWFFFGPYLIGHAYLYLFALQWAKVRRRVRIAIMRNEFFVPNKETDKDVTPDRAKLKSIFDRIDTSGDGRLDAMEFKIAIRASVGDDVPLEDCQKMIGSVDTDGDGTLDFNEFCELVDNVVLRL